MDSPSTDNYTLGKGVVYFDQLVNSVYQGERDMGNAPAFTFSVALEKLPHYSSRGGLKAKDKEIISQITPALAFTLDEVNKENLALLTLADISEVVQTQSVQTAEVVSAPVELGTRLTLAKRNIQCYTMPYLLGTVIFVVGEVVSGATGVATVLAVTGDSTSGTLTLAVTTPGFVIAETVTGDGTGSADVGATAEVIATGTPTILVQDSTDTTTYVAGTDYVITTSLKDDEIGRIRILSAAEGGSITTAEVLHVTYESGAVTYQEIQAFKNTVIEGRLRFVSDNPAGDNQELEVWRASLAPSGDTAMIGDDWSTLAFTCEILKDETNHPDSPYMDIRMIS